jgi:hypothetical protein
VVPSLSALAADATGMPLPIPIRRFYLLMLLSFAPALAAAGTQWHCELTPDLLQLTCRAAPPDAGAVEQPTTAWVNGTAFPLDAKRRWVVDLWSPPTEYERVELLARATICYRSPGCSVQLNLPQGLAKR